MNQNQRLTERDGPRALHGEFLGPAVEPGAQVAPGQLVLRLVDRNDAGQAREGARLLQHLYVHFGWSQVSQQLVTTATVLRVSVQKQQPSPITFFMLGSSSSSLIRATEHCSSRRLVRKHKHC